MKVTIIGAGNLAGHLARAFEKGGFEVKEIYARNINKALELSEVLYDCVAVNSLDFSNSPSGVFIISVSDDAIETVVSEMIMPEGAVVAHTSGAKTLSILDQLQSYNLDGIGVFYPIQTFTKNVSIDFKGIPICLEANTEKAYSKLNLIAKELSNRVQKVSSYERLVYHVGAIYSCNFVNHLWAISKEIVESENLDFDMLKPLIIETTEKMLNASHPADVQTGPAVRNDVKTINNHLDFLGDDEDLLKVYNTLTESISDWHRIDS